MFNFSANNQMLVSKREYDKCNVYSMKDLDTSRCYKVYDYTKKILVETNRVYSIFGKVNSADKLYLILEKCKERL